MSLLLSYLFAFVFFALQQCFRLGADVEIKAPVIRYNLEHHQSSNASNDRAIISLLRKYVSRHSQQALSKEFSKYCDRKYIVGTYSCPRQIGNRLHEFLNSFLAAVILDRTLLWHYCSQKYCNRHVSESECARVMYRKPWIPSAADALGHLHREGCISRRQTHVDNLHSLIHLSNRSSAEPQLACCPLERLQDKVLKIGRLERHEILALSKPGAKLSSDSRERAKILFANGEEMAYGYAFQACFNFSYTVVDWNNRPLHLESKLSKHRQPILKKKHSFLSLFSSQEKTQSTRPLQEFTVALHIRHTKARDSGHEDRGEEECLRTVLEAYQPENTQCVVLLASDREATISRLAAYIDSKGCDIRITRRESHRGIKRSVSSLEHGPWGDGFNSIADIELLSRADHFIGSAETYGTYPLSTYSMLIANLVALNGRGKTFVRKNRVIDEFSFLEFPQELGAIPKRRMQQMTFEEGLEWDTTEMKTDAFHPGNIHWLPYCSKSYGSYLESRGSPNWRFADKSFSWDCGNDTSMANSKWEVQNSKDYDHLRRDHAARVRNDENVTIKEHYLYTGGHIWVPPRCRRNQDTR